MAIAKTKSKTVKQDMAQAHTCTCQPSLIHKHLFLGGAITLMLVLATAQFALSRITWQEVMALKSKQEVPVEEPEAKLTTSTVGIGWFMVTLPSSFTVQELSVDPYIYKIGTSEVYATVYLESDQGLVSHTPIQVGDEWISVHSSEHIVAPANEDTTIADYWYKDSDKHVKEEQISQLRSVISSMQFYGHGTDQQ